MRKESEHRTQLRIPRKLARLLKQRADELGISDNALITLILHAALHDGEFGLYLRSSKRVEAVRNNCGSILPNHLEMGEASQ